MERQGHQSVSGVHCSLDLKRPALSFKHHPISSHLTKFNFDKKQGEAIAMDFTVHIGRVDVIKIHFLASPVQLLLWKAVDFSCLLQFRFIEFRNLSHILFVRYFGRGSRNGVYRRKSDATVATLPPFLTSPPCISASSVYCAILSLLVPKYFLLPFPNCACPQGSAFCSSPTMQFSHSQFYHWAYSSIYPAFNFPQGLSPVACGHSYWKFNL